jgi:acyl transferase domain-containing protein
VAKREQVPTQSYAWPDAGLRRASVNSFGMGGTNAHIVLDDAYHYMVNNGLSGNHQVQVYVEQNGKLPQISFFRLGLTRKCVLDRKWRVFEQWSKPKW